MKSRHAVPYCWGGLPWTQNELMRMKEFDVACPRCGVRISNEDVTDCVPLGVLVSQVRAAGSKLSSIVFEDGRWEERHEKDK